MFHTQARQLESLGVGSDPSSLVLLCNLVQVSSYLRAPLSSSAKGELHHLVEILCVKQLAVVSHEQSVTILSDPFSCISGFLWILWVPTLHWIVVLLLAVHCLQAVSSRSPHLGSTVFWGQTPGFKSLPQAWFHLSITFSLGFQSSGRGPRPFTSRPEVGWKGELDQIRQWAPGLRGRKDMDPQTVSSGWASPRHLEEDVGDIQRNTCFGTAEEKWLEQGP